MANNDAAQAYADKSTSRDLKDTCKKYNLSTYGKKVDLAARIIDYESKHTTAPEGDEVLVVT